jgi:trehalose synthase
MFKKVTALPTKRLDQYRNLAPDHQIQGSRNLSRSLEGKRVAHVSATAYGGGVAELLKSLLPLMNDLGVTADWYVLEPDERLFVATKEIHNALQGKPAPLNPSDRDYYLDFGQRLAAEMDLLEADLLIIHDPQPLSALPWLAGGRPVIGRLHIDLSNPEPTTMELVRPFLEACQAAVFSLPEFVPPGVSPDKARIIAPAIDPFSAKNGFLAREDADRILAELGLDPNKPIVAQVSRFDHWKDPLGVIEAFGLVKSEHSETQLVLAGAKADDDPEAIAVWEEAKRAADSHPGVFMFTNQTSPAVNDREINALQVGSDVIVQKSLREGFGLTVTEALWKSRPTVGGNVGGIRLQIADGETGFLVSSPTECAERINRLLADRQLADRLGRAGHEHVRRNFLMTRLLADHLRLYGELLN